MQPPRPPDSGWPRPPNQRRLTFEERPECFGSLACGTERQPLRLQVRVLDGQWQDLRVEVVVNQFRGFLDGRLVVEASDDAYAAGRPGLWTKADSVTCFDDVQISPS